MKSKEEKNRILFITSFPTIVAAPRIRVYQYLPLLTIEGIGYKILNVIPTWLYKLSLSKNIIRKGLFYFIANIARLIKALHVIVIASRYTVIFIQEVYFPLRVEKALAKINQNVVFDLADASYLKGFMGETIIEKARVMFYNQSRLLPRMLSVARCANITTPFLNEYVKQYCPNVYISPGPIKIHKRKDPDYKKPAELVIGWMGSPSTARYLYTITNVFRELQKQYHIKIKIIGAVYAYRNPDGIKILQESWKLEKETEQLYSFDIGIMPLLDSPWEENKGGYKLLNYMSVGLPVVASPIGINKLIIDDRENGFLADSHDEWIEKLSLLINDYELRKRIGLRGWETVNKYSVETQFPQFLKMIKSTTN